jgi:hypothetical protein
VPQSGVAVVEETTLKSGRSPIGLGEYCIAVELDLLPEAVKLHGIRWAGCLSKGCSQASVGYYD